ncbi:MAG: dipeptide epimerase [Planctomycetes bacterium]|nr:dipeptide epimerase [Planctomycetota bacterium]
MTFELRCKPYTLELRHRFTLANSSRTTTPTLLIELERDGIVGYGEAAMPPYLGETHASAQAFLERIELARIDAEFDAAAVLAAVDAIAPGNAAAKAAFDIALHDWLGKRSGQPHWQRLGLDPRAVPPTSFTIGIGEPDDVGARAAAAAAEFAVLKIKLGGSGDRAMIAAIRNATAIPIRVDVNQGWTDREHALREIEWLAARGVELVEQPMPATQIDDLAWLRQQSPLPIVADEAVQRLADVARAAGVYDGINIKLMKCTGLLEAHAMMTAARDRGLRIMLGCMTETSCAIAAACQLASLADWADLDGALLVANDPFEPLPFEDGRVLPTDRPGIGVAPRDNTRDVTAGSP